MTDEELKIELEVRAREYIRKDKMRFSEAIDCVESDIHDLVEELILEWKNAKNG